MIYYINLNPTGERRKDHSLRGAPDPDQDHHREGGIRRGTCKQHNTKQHIHINTTKQNKQTNKNKSVVGFGSKPTVGQTSPSPILDGRPRSEARRPVQRSRSLRGAQTQQLWLEEWHVREEKTKQKRSRPLTAEASHHWTARGFERVTGTILFVITLLHGTRLFM